MQLTIEELAHELEHYNSFAGLALDPLDPYLKAMSTFQSFTTDVIRALRLKDPQVTEISAAINNIYEQLPSFFEIDLFRDWVKAAMLGHPLRHTEKQHQWLHIVHRQAIVNDRYLSVSTIILVAVVAREDWQRRVLNPENLLADPDALYFFRREHNPRDVDSVTSNEGDEETQCWICMEPYGNGIHQPQQASCGHIHCKTCLKKWLEESKGRYTCPQCRACLVCNAHDCRHHVVDCDVAPPIPIMEFLKEIYDNAETSDGNKLGWPPSWLFSIREMTRGQRAALALIRAKLEALQGENIDSDRKVNLTRQSHDIKIRLGSLIEVISECYAAQLRARLDNETGVQCCTLGVNELCKERERLGQEVHTS
ncbi:hypothetical protein T440DRAFT_310509 [Plenodomus tracheiphilus IPT5]|uniref:RING-type domain-containing protein n=1 Tax=Plenodomus tracheiphilus IPT5 TaxID=1408161 RepID=A0A6A7BDU8_9PLEO|nr:hypothetical protein T440DRAFT_310509 [Plenodomus tracheiphilus IPT5]